MRVFDTVTGLPVHALVVHAVVVLLPMAAAGVVAIAAVPRWRTRFGPLVLLLLTGGLVLTPVATKSGEKLEGRVNAAGVVAQRINDHQDLGELLIWPVLVLWALTLALVFQSRRARPGRMLTVVAVLAAVMAIGTAGLVVRIGHLGSTAVWGCTVDFEACS
jgi:hypothetical protein